MRLEEMLEAKTQFYRDIAHTVIRMIDEICTKYSINFVRENGGHFYLNTKYTRFTGIMLGDSFRLCNLWLYDFIPNNLLELKTSGSITQDQYETELAYIEGMRDDFTKFHEDFNNLVDGVDKPRIIRKLRSINRKVTSVK